MSAEDHMDNEPLEPQITILGVGNILLSDEGVGVRVVERLDQQYAFPDNVQILDGGVLGVRLMGVIGGTDILIVVDAVKNQQPPGTLYRLADEQVPRRVLAKQSMHQLDLPEVLALCSAIDKNPRTVVVGVEPEDITTMDVELTTTIAAKVEDLVGMVLAELDRLGVAYTPKALPPQADSGS
jgi:hydrogenase maturation protease